MQEGDALCQKMTDTLAGPATQLCSYLNTNDRTVEAIADFYIATREAAAQSKAAPEAADKAFAAARDKALDALIEESMPFIDDLTAANGDFDCDSLPAGVLTLTMAGQKFTFTPDVYMLRAAPDSTVRAVGGRARGGGGGEVCNEKGV